MSMYEYAVMRAKYEITGKIVEYLESMISAHESELAQLKHHTVEVSEDENNTYNDCINELTAKIEVCKTMQDILIETIFTEPFG